MWHLETALKDGDMRDLNIIITLNVTRVAQTTVIFDLILIFAFNSSLDQSVETNRVKESLSTH